MKKYFLYIAIFCVLIIGIIVVLIKLYPSNWQGIVKKIVAITQKKINDNSVGNDLYDQVLPEKGKIIPAKLGNLGELMIKEGVIDQKKIDDLYAKRGSAGKMNLLLKENSSSLVVDKDNANYVLNFFWALGLGNKNPILSQGPMMKSGNPGNYASTGGWTLAKGEAMDHYSKHDFIVLDAKQQKMVEDMAKNIYRSCCGNSTYFPDCNHGMAMLGFLELMASQGFNEKEIYKEALVLNSFWFPNDYLTIAQYFRERGQDWEKIDPKTVLGKSYSSNQGIATVKSKVKNLPFVIGGGACGV